MSTGLESPTQSGTYFNAERVMPTRKINKSKYYEKALYDFTFSKIKKSLEYERRVYDFSNILGDFGGVINLIFLIIGIFIYPYN